MSALPEFSAANDPDALETQEWLDALAAVLEREGPERAHYLLEKLVEKARPFGRLHTLLASNRPISTRFRHTWKNARREITPWRSASVRFWPLECDGHGGESQQVRR